MNACDAQALAFLTKYPCQLQKQMDYGLLHGKNKWRTKALLNITQRTCFRNQLYCFNSSRTVGLLCISWLWDCWVQYSKGSWTENNSSLESSLDSQFSLSSFLISLVLKLLYSKCLPVFFFFSAYQLVWTFETRLYDCFWEWNKGKDYFEG